MDDIHTQVFNLRRSVHVYGRAWRRAPPPPPSPPPPSRLGHSATRSHPMALSQSPMSVPNTARACFRGGLQAKAGGYRERAPPAPMPHQLLQGLRAARRRVRPLPLLAWRSWRSKLEVWLLRLCAWSIVIARTHAHRRSITGRDLGPKPGCDAKQPRHEPNEVPPSSRLNCPGTGIVIIATRTRSKGR